MLRAFEIIEGGASESSPSAVDSYGEPGELRPSVAYFRRDLRESLTRDRAVTIGLVVCSELEKLKAWIEEQGMVPPKWKVAPREAEDRGW